MKIKKEYLLLSVLLVVTLLAVSFFGLNNEDDETPGNVESGFESLVENSEGFALSANVNISESKAPDESENSALTESDSADINSSESELNNPLNQEITEERVLKGVWISYLSLACDSEENFKNNYILLINNAKSYGITDLFVHVRPFMDAFFDSEYFPVSHLITGMQGEKLSFDPLEFMIDSAHDMGLKFHAWINPLRIKTNSTPKELSEENIYNIYLESDPYYFIESTTGVILNPAYSFTRELVSGGIREIVNKYDVDGIHFDDYFYPDNYDAESDSAYILYKENTDNPLSAEEWKKANVNSLIALCYQATKTSDKNVVFGISPQGNMENNLKIGADTKLWCETKGYIDYICPQLYYSFENPALGFSKALENWMNLNYHDGIKVYIGLAVYKVGTESDSGTWQNGREIIFKQENDAIEKGAQGYVLYEISHLDKLA